MSHFPIFEVRVTSTFKEYATLRRRIASVVDDPIAIMNSLLMVKVVDAPFFVDGYEYSYNYLLIRFMAISISGSLELDLAVNGYVLLHELLVKEYGYYNFIGKCESPQEVWVVLAGTRPPMVLPHLFSTYRCMRHFYVNAKNQVITVDNDRNSKRKEPTHPPITIVTFKPPSPVQSSTVNISAALPAITSSSSDVQSSSTTPQTTLPSIPIGDTSAVNPGIYLVKPISELQHKNTVFKQGISGNLKKRVEDYYANRIFPVFEPVLMASLADYSSAEVLERYNLKSVFPRFFTVVLPTREFFEDPDGHNIFFALRILTIELCKLELTGKTMIAGTALFTDTELESLDSERKALYAIRTEGVYGARKTRDESALSSDHSDSKRRRLDNDE